MLLRFYLLNSPPDSGYQVRIKMEIKIDFQIKEVYRKKPYKYSFTRARQQRYIVLHITLCIVPKITIYASSQSYCQRNPGKGRSY